jgi:hypothetical protein
MATSTSGLIFGSLCGVWTFAVGRTGRVERRKEGAGLSEVESLNALFELEVLPTLGR